MSEVVKVKPTARWIGPFIHIPRNGKVKRNGSSPVEVSPYQADWLEQRFFVTRVTEPGDEQPLQQNSVTEPGQETTHQPRQETVHQFGQETTFNDANLAEMQEVVATAPPSADAGDGLSEPGAAIAIDPGASLASSSATAPDDGLADWQRQLLDFFNNAADSDAIANPIRGVGTTTAERLIAAKPLDWPKVEEILTDTQVRACHKWLESQQASE